ncbi:hypothetical protein C5F48_21180, partial [Cereibacter changlensis JA139]
MDGQGGADEFIVNRGAAPVSYLLTFADSGAAGDGADILTLNLRDGADDEVLVRRNFVALLNSDAEGGLTPAVERINYDASINGRVIVNGLAGNDRYYVDDTATLFTLDGGAGDDFFQIGQMFGADRGAGQVAPGDEIETVETTQGFLSQGNALPMLVYGGIGADTFRVYSNKAYLRLMGEDGNDNFVIRAFLLKGSDAVAGGGAADALGGGGDDSFLYNINAPVNIDGGNGIDTVTVLGTEGDDSFLITDQGIYGAGLSISFAGVEVAEIDGMEGDDHFYILSTNESIATRVIGGLGSDTFSVGGDVMTDIISAGSGEATAGTVNHSVASTDPAYAGAYVPPLPVSVADPASSLLEVDTSGLAVLTEGGVGGYYRVRLTQAISAAAYLTVSAARSSTQDRESEATGSAQSVLVGAAPGAGASAVVLGFDASNWNQWQTVYVTAPQDVAAEGTRDVVISHSVTGGGEVTASRVLQDVDVTVFDDDLAYAVVGGNVSQIVLAEGQPGQALSLSLSRPPAAGETVTLTAKDLGLDVTLDRAVLTFDATNWNLPQTVIVTAVDDAAYENGERHVLAFGVSSDLDGSAFNRAPDVTVVASVTDNDRGSVVVTQSDGATTVRPGQSDSYTLSLSKQPTAAVTVSVATDGQTIAASSDPRFDAATQTVTFGPEDWDQPVEIVLSYGTLTQTPQPVLAPGLQPQELSAIRGPLQIWGGIGEGVDRSLTAGVMLPTETDAALPTVVVSVDETRQTDRLDIYAAGSVTDDSGTLTETNLSGFGMGAAGLTLNMGSDLDPTYVTYAAGISYAEFEVVELMLGSGDDRLDIASTAKGALTVIHGGGGSDTIRTVADSSGQALTGGADRALVVFGDTAQDGMRYDMRGVTATGNARAFDNPGDDLIDLTHATGSVVIDGGRGDDSLTGSDHGDQIAGGSGDDRIDARDGADHVYGDNGFRVDASIRLDLLTGQLITVVSAQDVTAAGFDAGTGDALTAAGNDTILGTGLGKTVVADYGVIFQAAGVQRAFDTGSVLELRALRVTEGGSDVITLGSGDDRVLAGSGDDRIDTGEGRGFVLADSGLIRFDAQGRVTEITATDDGSYGDD